MNSETITEERIAQFEAYLRENEKAALTIQKYIQVIRTFSEYLKGAPVTKEAMLSYRERLQEHGQARTVNAKISALNAYASFAGLSGYHLKFLKVQRKTFIDDNRELTVQEFHRLLLEARRRNQRLYHILLTICGTGIRVSELRFISVENAQNGLADIRLKGKSRTIILTKDLTRKLLSYAKARGITSGMIFRTRSGKPVDRSNICHEMKRLCQAAKVNPHKVFPHNLRHLFARSYYAIEKNLAHLADILGHSSVETTRIYVATGIRAHARTLQKMNLII